MNGKIIVVTHKDYPMPEDELYMPICVGSGIPTLQDKFQADNIGVNISDKNATYCELTAIYWVWKNLNIQNMDYLGVAHYRRHFSTKRKATSLQDVITRGEIDNLMNGGGQVVVPPKRRYLTSIEHHYIHSLRGHEDIHKRDIELLRMAINECSPEYEKTVDLVLNGKCAHMLNMFIMSTKLFETYCSWLFPVIDKTVEYNLQRESQKRYAGALSEFCLDIWMIHNHIEFKEVSLLEMEKMSYFQKAKNRLSRQLLGK